MAVTVAAENLAISCSGLTVGYGGAPVLENAHMSVPRHCIVGVLGRNGAGKTTLLESLAGARRVSSGRIEILGDDVTRDDAATRVRNRVALVPQGRRIVAGMSVRENLIVGAHTVKKRLVQSRLEAVCEMFPALVPWMSRDGVSLSGGQQQLLAVARALMSDPQVLLLDEPLTGLAPVMVEEVCETIARTREGRAAVVIAEQNASAAVSIADRVLVIAGSTIEEVPGETADERLEHVHRSFLGGEPPAAPDNEDRV